MGMQASLALGRGEGRIGKEPEARGSRPSSGRVRDGVFPQQELLVRCRLAWEVI